MASKSVTKAVAKKLKYYVDIKRREDAFDLSGPNLPLQDPIPLKPGPTLTYDGIHDRSLKHYFHNPKVKTQVGKLPVPLEKSCRENQIRRTLDIEMSKQSYKLSSESPYDASFRRRATPPRHRPQALISVDEYLKTKRGSKQRKVNLDIVGKPQRVLRRSPPEFVGKNEHERLVNMAARLIAATEAAALPGNRYFAQLAEENSTNSTYEISLPDVQSYTEESSDNEIARPLYPRPPSRAGGPRPRWTPPERSPLIENGGSKRKTLSKSSNNSDTSENTRSSRVNQHKIPKKKEILSSQKLQRPATASKTVRRKPLEPYLQHAAYRPMSARIESQKNEKTSTSSEDNGRKVKLFHSHSTPNNIPRVPTLTYQIYILTGDRRGAGTEADIKLTLFGRHGFSGERPLVKSMNHSRKFQRGKVDIFPLDSLYLGQLQTIRIGHSKTTSEYGWFLDKVYVSEGKNENRVFEFSCQRWFSSQKDDGQIVRDISLSSITTEFELNEKVNEYKNHELSSSEDESDVDSYASEFSDDDKRILSSEDDGERSTREETRKSRTEKNSRARKDHETYERNVSFDAENDEQDSDRSDEKAEKSEDESEKSEGDESAKSDYSSNSSYTDDDITKQKKPGDETSKNSNSGEETSGGKNSEYKKSEVEFSGNVSEISEDKNFKGKNTPDKSPKGENAEVGEEDDFWSVTLDKPEQIFHDLGVENEKNEVASVSRSSSSASSENEHVDDGKEDEQETIRKEGNDSESRNDEKSVDEKSSKENVRSEEKSEEDENKDYMAGFVAGVRASEHEKELKEDVLSHERDEFSRTDEQAVIRKGPSLHVAVSTGDTERVKELIQVNPSLKDHSDEKGWIPLHVGCSAGQLECVKLIAVSGGNLEQETPTGYTSMHLAAMNGHVNCMMVLFALGAEISCRTIDEYTPLHLAAMSGHGECVKWLLANRAKYDVKDVNGRTPGDLAEEYCYEDVAKLLKSFKKELKRTDSTLSHLMTYEGKRRKSTESVTSETADTLSKIADRDAPENGEENLWVSDNDTEGTERNDSETEPAFSGQQLSSGSRPASARKRAGLAGRPGSARTNESGEVISVSRTDSMSSIQEKQKLFEQQQQQMKRRNSSFLDSIRMDVEDDMNKNF